MRRTLKKLVISATGSLGHTHDQLRRWVENNSGKWISHVEKGITHLICSEEAWKQKTPAVTAARRFDAQIVSFDWLEDTLQQGKVLGVKKYLLNNAVAARKETKARKRLATKFDTMTFEEGSKKAQGDLGTGTSKKKSASTPASSEVRTSAPRPPKDGFFRSSLSDLKKKREERDAKARAAAEAKALAKKENGVGDEGFENKEQVDEQSKSAHPVIAPQDRGLEGLQSSSTLTGTLSSSSSPPYSKVQHQLHSTGAVSAPVSQTQTDPSDTLKPKAKAPLVSSYTSDPSNPLGLSRSLLPLPSTTQHQPAAVPEAIAERLPDLYHVYTDATGFMYDVSLYRADFFNNTIARYKLRIYESHTTPHVYCTLARYEPPAQRGQSVPTTKATVDEPIASGNKSTSATRTTATANSKDNKDKDKDKENTTSATEPTKKPTKKPPSAHHPKLAAALSLVSPSFTHNANNANNNSSTNAQNNNTPWRGLLAAQSSPFAAAFLAFRHAFRDLTLLSWEERVQPQARSAQAARAAALDREPFVYHQTAGAPLGLVPAGVVVCDEGYVRGALGLPGMQVVRAVREGFGGGKGMGVEKDDGDGAKGKGSDNRKRRLGTATGTGTPAARKRVYGRSR